MPVKGRSRRKGLYSVSRVRRRFLYCNTALTHLRLAPPTLYKPFLLYSVGGVTRRCVRAVLQYKNLRLTLPTLYHCRLIKMLRKSAHFQINRFSKLQNLQIIQTFTSNNMWATLRVKMSAENWKKIEQQIFFTKSFEWNGKEKL